MAQSVQALTRVTGSRAAADHLRDVAELTRHWLRQRAEWRPLVDNHQALLGYLRAEHAFAPNECLRVLFLNGRNRLLLDEIVVEGSVDEAPFWPRVVLRRCLELDAVGVIVVHNHPSGDHDPSAFDVQTTRRFCLAARELRIDVQDHLIFSSAGHSSLRLLGRM
jgi:DNA repair protein RadC